MGRVMLPRRRVEELGRISVHVERGVELMMYAIVLI